MTIPRYLSLPVAAALLLLSAGELRADDERDCWLNDIKAACDRAIGSGKFQDGKLARLLLARSRELLKAGQRQRAIDDVMAAIKATPTDSAGYVRLGKIHEEGGDIDGALAVFERAISSGQLQKRALANLYEARADLWIGKRESKKAIDDLVLAIGAAPSGGMRQLQLGELYAEDGDPERALATFTRAIELRKDDTDPLTSRARLHRRSGSIELAIADYDQAIKIDPLDFDLYNLRGVAYAEMGDLDSAIADFDQAILLDGKSSATYVNRGDAWRRNGDYQRAIADYDAALSTDPANLVCVLKRAITHRARGDYDKALADFDRVQNGKAFDRVKSGINDNSSVLYERGVTFALKRDFQKSAADLSEFIAAHPNHALAFQMRGLGFAASNQAERAIADFSEAIRLDPGNAEFYVVRSWQSHRMGRPRLALFDVEVAIRLDPDLASAYATRAQIREALGDHALAEADRRAAGAARARVEKARSEAFQALMKGRQGQMQAEAKEETAPARPAAR